MKNIYFILIICTIVMAVFAIGCSSKGNPIASSPDANIPIFESMQGESNHQILGAYTAVFDIDNLTATIEPDRELSAHFNVTSYLPSPGVEVISYNPSTHIIEAKVTIRNPHPVNAYDLRLILFTDSIGHMLMNSDDWTSLYDIPGGMDINPFKAYAKGEPQRVFASGTSHTEDLLVLLPNGNINVKFAIDASYPANCMEPYSIYNFQHAPLYDEPSATADVEVSIKRWNELSTVSVLLECPAVLGTATMVLATDDNKYFHGSLVNHKAAPVGEYQGIIKAKTNASPLYLYDVVTIVVSKMPEPGWVVQFPDDRLNGIEVDNLGNSYLCLGAKPDIHKYDKNGDFVWMRDLDSEDQYNEGFDIYYNRFDDFIQIAGSFAYCGTRTDTGLMAGRYSTDNQRIRVDHQCLQYTSYCSDITSDENQNSYLTGSYAVYGVPDAIMAKLDSMGNTMWSKDFNSAQGQIDFKDLEYSDTFETIYGVGIFIGTYVDFNPPSGTLNVYAKGAQDAFLAEWDSDGNCRKVASWGDSFESLSAEVTVNSIALDNFNNIFVVGNFIGEVDFDPSSSISIRTSYGGNDIYVSKFDSSGNFVKCIRVGGTGLSDFGNGIAVDLNGNVYFTGGFNETVDFDPGYNKDERTSNGSLDIYLAKFTNNLEYEWVRTWGDTVSDEGLDVECDPNTGNIILSGTFQGTVDFDPGTGVHNLTADAAGDIFLMKLLPNGYWE